MIIRQAKKLCGLHYFEGKSYEQIVKYPARQMTINGVTKDPTFMYKGGYSRGTKATTWEPDKFGETLDITGGGDLPTLNRRSTKYNYGQYYQADNNSFADPANDDFVIELIFRNEGVPTSLDQFIGKYLDAQYGWLIYAHVTASVGTSLFLSGTLGAATLKIGDNDYGVYHHIMFFGDRSGYGSIYVDGVYVRQVDISGIGSIVATAPLVLGARYDNVDRKWDGSIALAAQWQGLDWLDTHLQATIAAERFASIDLNQFQQRKKEDVVVNGDFNDGLTGWYPILATLEIKTYNNNNVLRTTTPGIANARAKQDCLTIGKTYRATGRVRCGPGMYSASFYIGRKSFIVTKNYNQNWINFDLTWKTEDAYIYCLPYYLVAGSYTEWDNIVIREVEDI